MADGVVLFCMPFAGGSSLTYAPWNGPLSAAGIELRALDYPGRGARAHRPLSETVNGLIDILQSEVVSTSAVDTYCLFGHSMGALVTYELAASMKAAGCPRPRAVFLSGSNPPHRLRLKDRRLLDDEELLTVVGSYGGIDERILKNVAARSTLLRVLRADYQALETHDWAFRGPLDAPIVLFTSDDDPVVDEGAAREWSQYSSAGLEICGLGDAGHLYLGSRQGPIVQKIVATALPGKP